MPLVAHWPLYEDTGTTANDVTGNLNDGTVNGATTGASGILGNTAYNFDGTDDYVDIPNFTNIKPITVSTWVKLDAPSDGNNDFAVDLRDDIPIGVYGRGNGTVDLQAKDGVGWKVITDGAASTEWTHYCITVDSTVEGYKNGSRLGSEAFGDFGSASSGGNSRIGSASNGVSWCDGRIADARVYDHALAPADVQYLAAAPQRARLTTDWKVA